MKQFSYTLTDENGLHARPAGNLVKLAKKFKSNITIETNGKKASAKKLFNLMGLEARFDSKLNVYAEGEDEDEAVVQIEEYFKQNL